MGRLLKQKTTRWALNGKPVKAGTKGATKTLTETSVWYAEYLDASRKRVRKSTGETDKMRAAAVLAEREENADLIRRGKRRPEDDQAERPLAEHVADFRKFLEAKGDTPHHVGQVTTRLLRIINGCGFKGLNEITPSKVMEWLDKQRQQDAADGAKAEREGEKYERAVEAARSAPKGQRRKAWTKARGLKPRRGTRMSIQTLNYYLVAAKSFTRWLFRDGRATNNPLAHLSGLNARTDRRGDRRALDDDELANLIETTRASTKRIRVLSGPDRAMLYTVAVSTGLRASELASLTPKSFDLAGEQPTVKVAAAYSKHRREDVLPLRSDLAEEMADWLADKDDDVPIWPGSWVDRPVATFKRDLAAAGIDFKTDDGQADFHALRHTFISRLAKAGVHVKVAQQLARHSTITLTMDRYVHLGLVDMQQGLDALPSISEMRSNAKKPVDDAKSVG